MQSLGKFLTMAVVAIGACIITAPIASACPSCGHHRVLTHPAVIDRSVRPVLDRTLIEPVIDRTLVQPSVIDTCPSVSSCPVVNSCPMTTTRVIEQPAIVAPVGTMYGGYGGFGSYGGIGSYGGYGLNGCGFDRCGLGTLNNFDLF